MKKIIINPALWIILSTTKLKKDYIQKTMTLRVKNTKLSTHKWKMQHRYFNTAFKSP